MTYKRQDDPEYLAERSEWIFIPRQESVSDVILDGIGAVCFALIVAAVLFGC